MCCCLALLALPLAAQSLPALVREHRASPSAATRAALARFAESHPRDDQGALALLALGATTPEDVALLSEARRRLPLLADYAAVPMATAHVTLGQHGEALSALQPALQGVPASPWLARAAEVSIAALLAQQKAADAQPILALHGSRLSSAKRDLLAGQVREALGQASLAIRHYQRVYASFPTVPEAAAAADALGRLNALDALPSDLLFTRAAKLADAGQPKAAQRELQQALPRLGGAEADTARVRIAAADYHARANETAYRALAALHVDSAEADAERLYYLHAAARRLERAAESAEAVRQLSSLHARSPWRLQALVSAGNQALLENQGAIYVPLFRACHSAFPEDKQAPYCHWKVAWSAYLQRSPDAERLLREHVVRYPSSEKASAALYFLGRLADARRTPGEAVTLYRALDGRFPNSYYAVLARQQLTAVSAVPVPLAWLQAVSFPPPLAPLEFAPTDATRRRLARARLLASGGFDDWADFELRFAATEDGQPHVLALELARQASQRGEFHRSVAYIKRYAPHYLSVPLSNAPAEFWRHAFPLPYQSALEENARAQGLDPFLLAALIRQESVFDPNAVSVANALGLTQLMPATGREWSRRLGVRNFTTSMLFEPATNLRLGAAFVRSLLDRWQGRWERTLAAYNGGPARVAKWSQWASYREPAEFIETIPFTETRTYVQAVLRNADVYRRLWGGEAAATRSFTKPMPLR